MKSVFLSLVLFTLSMPIWGQKMAGDIKPADFKRLQVLEDSIAAIAKVAVQDSLLNNRLLANGELIPLIKEVLNIPNSFNYAFTKVENISIQRPNDGALRLFTWQLYINEDEYKYFGYVQLNRAKPTFFELNDAARQLQESKKEMLSPDRWFGALYYNVKEFKTKEDTKYLLFGYNAHDRFERIKLCDVLVLRGGQIKFGAPVFEIADIKGVRKQKLHRLILTYSAQAAIRLNYDPQMNIVVHDHLEKMGTKDPNIPFTYVPDGTYEAFELQKDGIWSHVDKLATTEMDEAPRPEPKLNSRNRVKTAKNDAQKFEWPKEVKKDN
ncbi:MAG: hypothetical protein JNL70_27995 [Saprospiraceae bacterium]|nr:hypothetical protein [Saprospiraceae bacterium]